MEPDICMDILQWNYKDYEKFDVIWASPNCKEYSISKTRAPRDMESADKLVLKVLEIIEYFKPKYFFIENPYTGYLKSREFMKDIPYYRVDYCRYGFDYKKNTAIWTNLENFNGLKCDNGLCGKKVNGSHIDSICDGKKLTLNRILHPNRNFTTKYTDKIKIPQTLLLELFELLLLL